MRNKTHPTELSPDEFLASFAEPRRADAIALAALMSRASGEPPRMWGPSIVGFGVRTYALAGGKQGETLQVGFSPRKAALVLYGLGATRNQAAVNALGKLTTGKGCVYVKRLADIDLDKLEALLAGVLRRP